MDSFVEFLHEQGEKIVADKPDGLLARVLGGGSAKRRLTTLSGVADRLGERMQVGWGGRAGLDPCGPSGLEEHG